MTRRHKKRVDVLARIEELTALIQRLEGELADHVRAWNYGLDEAVLYTPRDFDKSPERVDGGFLAEHIAPESEHYPSKENLALARALAVDVDQAIRSGGEGFPGTRLCAARWLQEWRAIRESE